MNCYSYCNAPLIFLPPIISNKSPSKVQSSPFFCSVRFCCRSMWHSCCGHRYLSASEGFFFVVLNWSEWKSELQGPRLTQLEKNKCSGLTSLSAHEQTGLCSCKVLVTICHSYYFSPNLLPFLFYFFFFSPILTSVSVTLVHRGYGNRYLCTDTLTQPQRSYHWQQKGALRCSLCTGFWSFRFTHSGVSQQQYGLAD